MTVKLSAPLAKARVYTELNALENGVKELRSRFEEADRSTNEEAMALERERDELREAQGRAASIYARIATYHGSKRIYRDPKEHYTYEQMLDELIRDAEVRQRLLAPDAYGRVLGRKDERDRILRIIKDRQHTHVREHVCEHCANHNALISAIEGGE